MSESQEGTGSDADLRDQLKSMEAKLRRLRDLRQQHNDAGKRHADSRNTIQKEYKKLREDGRAIEVGENDALIIEKLVADKNMFGIFGYSFFDQNRDKVQAAILDDVELNFENIASYKYPGARPLFFYVKKQHVGVIPGIREFINEFVSEKAMGLDGYLFPAGLVPLSEDDFAKQIAAKNSL